jgi:hypothetical protein
MEPNVILHESRDEEITVVIAFLHPENAPLA